MPRQPPAASRQPPAASRQPPAASRQPPALRARFTDGVRGMAERVGAWKGAGEDEALAMLASLIGALVLARAVDNPALSERILAATKERLLAG